MGELTSDVEVEFMLFVVFAIAGGRFEIFLGLNRSCQNIL